MTSAEISRSPDSSPTQMSTMERRTATRKNGEKRVTYLVRGRVRVRG